MDQSVNVSLMGTSDLQNGIDFSNCHAKPATVDYPDSCTSFKQCLESVMKQKVEPLPYAGQLTTIENNFDSTSASLNNPLSQTEINLLEEDSIATVEIESDVLLSEQIALVDSVSEPLIEQSQKKRFCSTADAEEQIALLASSSQSLQLLEEIDTDLSLQMQLQQNLIDSADLPISIELCSNRISTKKRSDSIASDEKEQSEILLNLNTTALAASMLQVPAIETDHHQLEQTLQHSLPTTLELPLKDSNLMDATPNLHSSTQITEADAEVDDLDRGDQKSEKTTQITTNLFTDDPRSILDTTKNSAISKATESMQQAVAESHDASGKKMIPTEMNPTALLTLLHENSEAIEIESMNLRLAQKLLPSEQVETITPLVSSAILLKQSMEEIRAKQSSIDSRIMTQPNEILSDIFSEQENQTAEIFSSVLAQANAETTEQPIHTKSLSTPSLTAVSPSYETTPNLLHSSFDPGQIEDIEMAQKRGLEDLGKMIIQQLQPNLKLALRRNSSELQMHLRPDLLGFVKVRMQMIEEKMIVAFTVDNQSTKEMLQSQVNTLKKFFNDQKIQTSEFKFELLENNASMEQEASSQQQQRRYTSPEEQRTTRSFIFSQQLSAEEKKIEPTYPSDEGIARIDWSEAPSKTQNLNIVV